MRVARAAMGLVRPRPGTAASVATPLKWTPPTLTAPTTMVIATDPGVGITHAISQQSGTAKQKATFTLDNTKDYIIRVKRITSDYGLIIDGGRNVWIFGGHISIPHVNSTDYATMTDARTDFARRRALLVAGGTSGVVHVEGLYYDRGADGTGSLTEGINTQCPNRGVQIQNGKIGPLTSFVVPSVPSPGGFPSFDDNHPDVIQPLGGLYHRIDMVHGITHAHFSYLAQGDAPSAVGSEYNLSRALMEQTNDYYPSLLHKFDSGWTLRLADVFFKKPTTKAYSNTFTDEGFTQSSPGGVVTYAGDSEWVGSAKDVDLNPLTFALPVPFTTYDPVNYPLPGETGHPGYL